MAYSAYCDTDPPTKWWITGTGSVVNRLSEVMDDNAAGVEEKDDPGNFQPWTSFMTETVGDAIYLIHMNFWIGDDTTATTLEIPSEMVRFDDGVTLSKRSNADLYIGTVQGDWASGGAKISLSPAANMEIIPHNDTGDLFIYGSIIELRPTGGFQALRFRGGDIKIVNSMLYGGSAQTTRGDQFTFEPEVDSLEFKRVLIANFNQTTIRFVAPDISGFWTNYSYRSINSTNASITLTGSEISQYGNADYQISANINPYTLSVVDPVTNISTPLIAETNGGTGTIKEQYTCNIHIADKDGANLAGVTVDCEDTNTDAVWAAGTITTDANGVITEQTITYKSWTGTSETLVTFSPHKFTLSKAGYETLVLNNITVDGPVDWHLELQPAVKITLDGDLFRTVKENIIMNLGEDHYYGR